jgi:hypothetical protein
LGKIDEHRAVLAEMADWSDYLTANSRLPGPRANLELVAACGEEADLSRALSLLASGDEFQMVCGLVALGRLVGEGDQALTELLHQHASDPRWRIREAVAMALQRAADSDPEAAFESAALWAGEPDPLVRRAAVAAVAEPRLIADPSRARRALLLLDLVTADLARIPIQERRAPPTRTLRQALGYAWSVVIAALPDEGLSAFRRLQASPDPDIQWIVRENLKKARLRKLLES